MKKESSCLSAYFSMSFHKTAAGAGFAQKTFPAPQGCLLKESARRIVPLTVLKTDAMEIAVSV